MYIFGIDAGSKKTGYVLWDDSKGLMLDCGKVDNEKILDLIIGCPPNTVFVLEQFRVYAKAGQSIITSATWNGQFIRQIALRESEHYFYFKSQINKAICGKGTRVNDKDIRAALTARFPHTGLDGKGNPSVKGTKAHKGPLYGIGTDAWSALAVIRTHKKVINGNKK